MLAAGILFAGQPEPVKTLNDNALQHVRASDVVTTVTSRQLPWFAQESGSEGRQRFPRFGGRGFARRF